MKILHYKEYTSVQRYNSFSVSDEHIKELIERCKKSGEDSEYFKEQLYTYLEDIRWANQEDSEIEYEDTDDTDWCEDVYDFINKMAEEYDEFRLTLGEFGNT